MDNLMGLLRIKVKRGINLAIRDVCSSDPYVVVKMAKQSLYAYLSRVSLRQCSYRSMVSSLDLIDGLLQKLKTRVVKKDVNPEWNEDLTLSIADYNLPIHLTVYDHDTFSLDDRMGDAEFDIKPFIEAVKTRLEGLPDGTIITKVPASRTNCLSEESSVVWKDGKVVQDLCLRLRNVECGEVEIQLQWINVPGSRGLNMAY
ncbi:hypothetical protein SASPL_139415 [Salvia splendens]|uniref:C2 domain-containing protein n=1 Tax=Salvia splendens TaxID=180675 RepID=A0A8X8WM10_SALSN|nr:hypothetical protein SASPL_139415 [Salvia splendens]